MRNDDNKSAPAMNHAKAALLTALDAKFGPRFSANETVRRQHANALTFVFSRQPDAVVWPLEAAEVAAIVAMAGAHGVPLIPYGAGTSLEGHVNAPQGGVAVDLSRMNRIVEVREQDGDCTVEAGVTLEQLNRHLRHTGFFFPVDPGAVEATLGGMAATRASGTNAVRYGTMRDNVLNLIVVMASGALISTGGRARKSAAGYDLARLLVGSEGTLGIITELTLRIFPVPGAILAAVAPFDTIENACNTAIASIQHGLSLARIELLDAETIAAVNAYSKLTLTETPTLFVEFHGVAAALKEEVAIFEELAKDNGARAFQWASEETDRRRIWKARHDAYWAIRAHFAGKSSIVTDICVPISSLARCVTETDADFRSAGIAAPILGHVGDGNFHATPMFDAQNPREVAVLRGVLDCLAARAIAAGGTCSGEHGIGEGKITYLAAELGPALEVLRDIKRALDPLGILNPGKIFR